VFFVIVTMLIGSNFKSLALLAQASLFPVLFTFVIAVGLGWGIGWLAGLMTAERRAVAIEVAFQNVALAIGLGITFFPSLGGITAVSILWGIVHLTLGSGLALAWSRQKIK
jgi:BASS family bile acid:Na+ symporter